MATIDLLKRPTAFEIRGIYGRLNTLGQYLCGLNDIGDDDGRVGVYQRRRKNGKQIFIKMLHVISNLEPTENQAICRAKFGDAVRSWQALTLPERIAYRQSVRCWRKTAYHVYIKQYMATH